MGPLAQAGLSASWRMPHRVTGPIVAGTDRSWRRISRFSATGKPPDPRVEDARPGRSKRISARLNKGETRKKSTPGTTLDNRWPHRSLGREPQVARFPHIPSPKGRQDPGLGASPAPLAGLKRHEPPEDLGLTPKDEACSPFRARGSKFTVSWGLRPTPVLDATRANAFLTARRRSGQESN
jgi:hypothetical protein